jgi:hypothetical protein
VSLRPQTWLTSPHSSWYLLHLDVPCALTPSNLDRSNLDPVLQRAPFIIYIYIYMYMYIYVYICMYIYINRYIYRHKHIHTCIHMYIYVYVCTYVCF